MHKRVFDTNQVTKGESKDDNVGKKARQAVIDGEYVEDDSPLPLSSVSANNDGDPWWLWVSCY